MKCKIILLAFLCNTIVCTQNNCQTLPALLKPGAGLEVRTNSVNFFVISKRQKGRFDVATKYNIVRTKLKKIFHGKNFMPVVAKNGTDMCAQIEKKLKKRNAQIGTIWFDSHGKFKKGYALFTIGENEYNYSSIKDSSLAAHFIKLAPYIGPKSSIIIGSCYGGATFKRLTNRYKDTAHMRGDSLMIYIGMLLKNGVVYGSESWVMSRPGLFLKKMSLYGNPGRKKFHDTYFKPAWESIGKWNKYEVASSNFMPANAITLNSNGQLIEFKNPFYIKKKYKKSIKRTIENLKPGMLKENAEPVCFSNGD